MIPNINFTLVILFLSWDYSAVNNAKELEALEMKGDTGLGIGSPHAQLKKSCSKSSIDTIKKGVKYVQR